jgi:glycoside/pentoside/hexuronide:cation symporter, GPH family
MLVAALASRPGTAMPPPRAASRVALLPKPDRLLAAMAVIACVTGFAMPMFGRMVLYLATYVLDRPALASRILLAVTLGQFPGVLLWTWLVRYADKTVLLAISYLAAVGGVLLCVWADSRAEWLVAAAAFTGIGLAGVFMLPWGILADVIDFVEFRQRERRETATFASFLVIIKASAAASVGMTGWALGRLGYVAGAHQPAAVLKGMKMLAFGVPILGSVAALLVLLRLSVGHRAHAKVLRVLGTRRLRASQGSSGSRGSTRIDDREGRKVNSKGESRLPTAPG